MSFGQIAAAVVAVLIVAFAVWRRDRLSGERKLLAAGVVIACAVYASGALSLLPDPKKVIEDIAETLGAWTYLLVGVMAFLETGAFVGLVAPGETVVIAGGVIAGQGEIELIPLIGLVWTCAILGDTTSFFIGRRLGREFLEKHGARVKITHERLEQVDGYFERHGGKTILIGRFIGLVRALAPFIAGSSRMSFGNFIPYSVVGTGLWATTFCVLGYVFWRSFDQVANIAGQAIFGLGLTVAVIVAIVVTYRRRASIAAWLTEHERHPLLRPVFAVARPLHRRVILPLARALAPEARFLGERLTPGGGVGLELTTTLAVGGVGLYVFVLYTVVLSGDLGPTPLDRELLDVADRLRADAAVRASQDRDRVRLLPRLCGPRARDRGGGGASPPRRGGHAARSGLRAHLRGRAPGQGGNRPAAPRGPADRHAGVGLPERPRRIRHGLAGGRGGDGRVGSAW